MKKNIIKLALCAYLFIFFIPAFGMLGRVATAAPRLPRNIPVRPSGTTFPSGRPGEPVAGGTRYPIGESGASTAPFHPLYQSIEPQTIDQQPTQPQPFQPHMTNQRQSGPGLPYQAQQSRRLRIKPLNQISIDLELEKETKAFCQELLDIAQELNIFEQRLPSLRNTLEQGNISEINRNFSELANVILQNKANNYQKIIDQSSPGNAPSWFSEYQKSISSINNNFRQDLAQAQKTLKSFNRLDEIILEIELFNNISEYESIIAKGKELNYPVERIQRLEGLLHQIKNGLNLPKKELQDIKDDFESLQKDQQTLEQFEQHEKERIEAERKEADRLAQEQAAKEQADQQVIENMLKDFNAEFEAKELQKFEEQLLAKEKEIDAEIETGRKEIEKQFAAKQAEIEAQAQKELDAMDKDARKTITEKNKEIAEIEERYSQEMQKLETEEQQALEKTKIEAENRLKDAIEKASKASKKEALQPIEPASVITKKTTEPKTTNKISPVEEPEFPLEAEQAKEEALKNLETAQKNKLKAEKEAADKKAAFELAEKNEAEAKKQAEEAQKAAELKKSEGEGLKKHIAELEKEIAQEKEKLTQEQQTKVSLEQETTKKQAEVLQEKTKQELAEKEEARLLAEQAAQKALAAKEAAEKAAQEAEANKVQLTSAEKIANENLAQAQKDFRNSLAKKQSEQEEAERKKLAEVERKFELPDGDTQLPKEKVPTSEKLFIEIPAMPLPAEKEIQTPDRIPMPAQLPKRELSMTDTQEQIQNLPEEQIPSLPQLPLPSQLPEQAWPEMEPSESDSVEIIPIQETSPEPATIPSLQQSTSTEYRKQPRPKPTKLPEATTEMAMPTSSGKSEPLQGTQFPLFGFPETKTPPPHKPIIPRGTWTTPNTPTSSYSGASTSSSSGDWPTTTYESSFAKASDSAKAMSETTADSQAKPKIRPEARILLEKLFAKKEPEVVDRETTESKGFGGLLKGAHLLIGQHKAATQKKAVPIKEPEIAQKTIKTNPILSAVKQVTTTIANVINNVIDTIGSYLNRLFTPNKPT